MRGGWSHELHQARSVSGKAEMKTEPSPKAVRVEGEIVVLHCWACGTAHCVNPVLCGHERLAHMVYSNRNCRMSMPLVNELILDNKI